MLSLLRYLRHGPLKVFSPIWLWLGAIYRRGVGRGKRTVRQNIGPYGPFRLDARFAFSNFANWGGAHNDGFRPCVEACRGKTCVIDVGAHIGLVSLPVLSVMAPNGLLVAFEPAVANRYLLLKHFEVNGFQGRTRVESALVGSDQCDSVPFFEMSSDTGMNTVVPGAMGPDYQPVSRQQVSLDAYCASHSLSPEVIKIDVEGAELGVLRGACSLLERCRPTIFLSVHPKQIVQIGESLEGLTDLIHSMKYVCRHVDGSPMNHFELREYLLTPKDN
jgi:FkbM family methyltransferase